ncbi:MAG TPA: NADH-quinone oxidoreductase subunit C [Pyrinomonadaceae bacterium]|jgi:NADH-quinone oxidoreductase subunit C
MTDEPTKPGSSDAAATPDTPATNETPAAETPEQKKARLVAEAKAKSAARAAGQPAAPAATSDEEKAAKIAEAKARAASAKAAASPVMPSAPGGAAGAPKAPVKKKDEGPKPTDAAAHPLVKKLKARFGEEIIEATEFLGQLSVRLAPARIVEVCDFLKRDSETPFNLLTDLTCVHYPEHTDAPFEVVYNLYSISANARVRLKVWTSAGEGVASVTQVWPAANWMEREVYDLFGVPFKNHPDLRRLLLPPDWAGHPFRKDYPLKPVENEWTRKHLPPFDSVQQEQLEQRRAYGLELLSHPDERRVREIFIAGKEVMPLDRK